MGKIPRAEVAGFEPPSEPHPSLFPHQRDICEWAIRGGRRAVFANFGLGKTRIHLQLAKWVCEKTKRKFLIICPLGVRQEFTQSDGPAMGLQLHFCRTTAEAMASDSQIIVTNYESVKDEDAVPDEAQERLLVLVGLARGIVDHVHDGHLAAQEIRAIETIHVGDEFQFTSGGFDAREE